jgi:flagellar basal-body rod protein FlgF
MDNTIYVGLSRQMLLQHELDIAANNLANVDTAGFKLESMISGSDPTTPAGAKVGSTVVPLTFVTADGVTRDFSQGPLTQTGAPLDVAIDGKGFFKISTAAGTRYTRDGRFTFDPSGKLTTQAGDPVQGDGGDITLDPKKGPVAISADGRISQSGVSVGKLSVVTFDSLAALSKDGGNLYRNDSNLTENTATAMTLKQGSLEGSNVQPIAQITRLIEINQAYTAVSNMISSTGSLSNSAIQRLGAINPT